MQVRIPLDVANALKSTRTATEALADAVFWIGAGASVSAGIPDAEGVVDHFLERLWLSEQPRTDSDQIIAASWAMSEDKATEIRRRRAVVRDWALVMGRVPALDRWRTLNPGVQLKRDDTDWWKLYSACLDSFSGPAARQAFMAEVVQRGARLNVAHLRLAYLMHKKMVRTAITTNFDNLLRRALARYEEFPGEFDGNSIDDLTVNAPFLQVAYLHGTLTSYRQRHTGAEIKNKIPNLDTYLRQMLTTGCLVVVGYRGGNETPMDVLHKVICKQQCNPGRGLYWISRESSPEHLTGRVREILERPYTYWVPGCDADEFLNEICIQTVGPPTSPPMPDDLFASALEECDSASRKLQGGRLEEAIQHCKRALLLAPKLIKAYVFWGQALAFLARRPDQSLKHKGALLNDAIEKCRTAAELDPKSAEPLSLWGKALLDRFALFHERSDAEAALRIFETAVGLAPSNDFIYSDCAKALEILNRFDEAEEMRAHAYVRSPRRR